MTGLTTNPKAIMNASSSEMSVKKRTIFHRLFLFSKNIPQRVRLVVSNILHTSTVFRCTLEHNNNNDNNNANDHEHDNK